MEGGVTLRNRTLTLVAYRHQNAYVTNTFAIMSPRIDYFLNMSIHHLPDNATYRNPYRPFEENTALIISPGLFNLKELQIPYGRFHAHGFLLQIFRDSKDRQLFFVKLFERPYTYTLEDVGGEDPYSQKGMYCVHEYLNQTFTLNITMDFERLEYSLWVNGSLCVSHPIPADMYPENKCSMTLMSRSAPGFPHSVFVDEVSIHKLTYPLRDYQDSFHYSMHKLSHTVHHNDPHYLKNVSIANLFINGVSSPDTDFQRDRIAQRRLSGHDERNGPTGKGNKAIQRHSEAKDRRTVNYVKIGGKSAKFDQNHRKCQ